MSKNRQTIYSVRACRARSNNDVVVTRISSMYGHLSSSPCGLLSISTSYGRAAGLARGFGVSVGRSVGLSDGGDFL